MRRQSFGAQVETRAPATMCKTLPLGELEALPRALLAVLLALMFSRIAGQKTRFLQRTTQFGVELDQRPGDAQFDRSRLASDTAAVGKNQYIKTIGHLDRQERQPNRHTSRFGRKIIIQLTAVHRDFARSGPKEDSGDAALAAPGSQILFYFS